ncbi:MAG: hypothetical protein K6F85_02065 [Bacteroidales bacterium]|nr:hypothetical protein [Bacteroidales bacterium]
MTHAIQRLTLVLAATAMLLTASCHRNQQQSTDTPAAPDTVAVEPALEPEPEPEPEPVKTVAKPATAPKPAAATTAVQRGKSETIYVETDGAQGRVWGHVTMKGDRGTGTIHDWDENTMTVNVVRHGNELYAIDQNSRQYVFKLKQNKTQE